jgi:hypothetical protein
LTIAAIGSITGPITVGRIWRLQVDGHVNAPVTTLATDNWQASASAFSTRHIIVGGSVNPGAFITSGGSIEHLEVGTPANPPNPTTYKLDAKVVATNGKIKDLLVRGQINQNIRATYGIDSLDAYEVAGNITANYQNESPLPTPLHSGWIHSFRVTGPSETGFLVSGDVRANNAGDVALDQGLGVGLVQIDGPVTKPIRFEGSAIAPIRVGSLQGDLNNPGLFVGVDLLNDLLVGGVADRIHVERDINPSVVTNLYINAGVDIGRMSVGGGVVGDCQRSVHLRSAPARGDGRASPRALGDRAADWHGRGPSAPGGRTLRPHATERSPGRLQARDAGPRACAGAPGRRPGGGRGAGRADREVRRPGGLV